MANLERTVRRTRRRGELPGTRPCQETALPGVRSILLLTVRTAERPAAVPAPVHQAGQPLVAGQADRPRVVVRTYRPGHVREDQLSSLDVPGSDQQPATPLLLQDTVVHPHQHCVGLFRKQFNMSTVLHSRASPGLSCDRRELGIIRRSVHQTM